MDLLETPDRPLNAQAETAGTDECQNVDRSDLMPIDPSTEPTNSQGPRASTPSMSEHSNATQTTPNYDDEVIEWVVPHIGRQFDQSLILMY